MKGDKVDQARPAFPTSVIAGADPLFVLYVPCEHIQDDLFPKLDRHWGQAKRPLVPCILLTALPVDGHLVGQLQLSGFSLISQELKINDGQ